MRNITAETVVILGKKLSKAIVGILLFAIALLMLYPLIFMILGSFKPSSEVLTVHPTFLPSKFILDNYISIMDIIPITQTFLNSVFVTVTVTLLTVFFSSLAGYVFGKFRFPGRDFLFTCILACMMIPTIVIILPLFLLCNAMGLINSYAGLIIPVMLSPFGVYLITQFARGIPTDYLDAARLDGLSEFGIYCRIVLPLIRPALASLTILTFCNQWESLVWPMVIAQNPRYWTLPIAIQTVGFSVNSNFGAYLAIASVSVMPVIIVYIIFQKQFVNGMIISGLK